MKKLFIFSFLLLSACNTMMTTFDKVSAPPEKIPNPKCENVIQLEVFQVLDDFALANACTKMGYSMCVESHIVYIPKEKNKIYYDEQKIAFPEGKCVSYSGTYSYETKQEFLKTVPKVKFINDEITNPEYTKWIKENKEKEQN